jgi:hypothetical protein
VAVPYAADLDPDAVAGPGVAPAPEPMVMTPLGQLPASALPPDPNPPGAAPPPGQDVAPVNPGAPPPPDAGAAGAPGSGPAQPEPGALPPRPVRPPLTGDPAKDIQSSLGYERALDDWHAQVLGAAGKTQQAVMAEHAAKQLANEQALQKQHEELRQRQQAEREQYQRDVIGNATKERASAMGALENGTWRGDPHSGTKIAALILGAVGAGFSAAGGHPTGNLAAEAIDKIQQREYDAAKNRLASANEHALQARYGFKDLQENQRAALNDLDADFAAKNHLIAAEAENALRQRGASPEDIANHGLVQQALAKSAAYEDQIHQRELEEQRKQAVDAEKAKLDTSTMRRNNAQADAAEALAGFRNRRGAGGAGKGGGGGSGKAVDAMAAAADSGKSVAEVTKAGVAAGMSEKAARAAAKDYVNDAEKRAGVGKKGGAAGGVDPNLIVRDPSGTPIGMTSSSRDVPKARAFVINYDQAIRSLKDILASGDTIPRGSKFDNAVLAIASTTTAGATDANVRHEAGTLKNKLGVLDPEAISAKIKDLEERRGQFARTLTPLPAGYKDANTAAAPRKTIGGGVVYERGADGLWHKVAGNGDVKL